LLASKETINSLPDGLNHKESAEYLRKSLITVTELDALNLKRWQGLTTNLGVGVIAGLLQYVSLRKLIADQEESLLNESLDAKLRMYSGITTLAATTSETIGKV